MILKYKYIWPLLCLTASIANATLYENAEDGDINGNTPSNVKGWFVYDKTPVGAQILNVYDSVKKSRVIYFKGDRTYNGYMLGDWYPTSAGTWNNTREFVVHWCERYSEYFVVYMRVYTDKNKSYTYTNSSGEKVTYKTKQRYIYYTPSNASNGYGSGVHPYIHHGLGGDKANGKWHSITRDLQKDLNKYEPGTKITSVVAFLTRGSGKIDDLYLTQTAIEGHTFEKSSKTVYDPINKETNPKAIPGSIKEYTLKVTNDGFGNIDGNSMTIKDPISSKLRMCTVDLQKCKKPYLVSSANTSGLSISKIEYKVGSHYKQHPAITTQGFSDDATEMKITFKGKYPSSCSKGKGFEIKFRAGVK